MAESLRERLLDLAGTRRIVPGKLRAAAAPLRVTSPFGEARRVENLRRYLTPPSKAGQPALLVGLNPGIHGQMQTGIPFTDNQRLAWYGWVEGMRPSGHRRIEQSSRILYDCFQEAAAGDGEAFHRRLVMVNAFPYCLLQADKDAHPQWSIEKLIRDTGALRAETEAWLAASFEAVEPRAVVALGAFAEEMAAPLARKTGVPFARAPHPRALLYEKADGPRPRRRALVGVLRDAASLA